MTQVCKREWVIANSQAFAMLLQQGYLVVPKSTKTVRKVRWLLMQKMVENP